MHWAWCTPWGGIRRSSGSSCRDMSLANWEPWWFLQEFKAKKMWRTWFNVRFEFWFLVFLKRLFFAVHRSQKTCPIFLVVCFVWRESNVLQTDLLAGFCHFYLIFWRSNCSCLRRLPPLFSDLRSVGWSVFGVKRHCLPLFHHLFTDLVFEVADRLAWHFHHQRTLIISTEHTHPHTPWQDVRPRLPKLAEHVHQVKCHLEFLLVSIRCCNQQSCCHHHR